MSEYVPTEEVLKRAYTNGISANSCDDQSECYVCAEAYAHVDRFLARVRAEEWLKAADFLGMQRNLDDDVVPGVQLAASTLRWRAWQIEKGQDNE